MGLIPARNDTPMTSQAGFNLHTVSIVVPVFQGELTLEPLLAEIEPLTTPNQHRAAFHSVFPK